MQHLLFFEVQKQKDDTLMTHPCIRSLQITEGVCVCMDWLAVMELWGFLGGGFKVMFLLLNVRNSQTPTCETNSKDSQFKD